MDIARRAAGGVLGELLDLVHGGGGGIARDAEGSFGRVVGDVSGREDGRWGNYSRPCTWGQIAGVRGPKAARGRRAKQKLHSADTPDQEEQHRAAALSSDSTASDASDSTTTTTTTSTSTNTSSSTPPSLLSPLPPPPSRPTLPPTKHCPSSATLPCSAPAD